MSAMENLFVKIAAVWQPKRKISAILLIYKLIPTLSPPSEEKVVEEPVSRACLSISADFS